MRARCISAARIDTFTAVIDRAIHLYVCFSTICYSIYFDGHSRAMGSRPIDVVLFKGSFVYTNKPDMMTI